jgi:hypothetical protein
VSVALYGTSLVVALVLAGLTLTTGGPLAFTAIFLAFVVGITSYNTATVLSRVRAYADGSLEVRNRMVTRRLHRSDIDRVILGRQGGPVPCGAWNCSSTTERRCTWSRPKRFRSRGATVGAAGCGAAALAQRNSLTRQPGQLTPVRSDHRATPETGSNRLRLRAQFVPSSCPAGPDGCG